ncbi:hypothetical protein MAA5396_02345 [Marinovum algicola]|uniref:Uncharacterized protein n=1 Tax=Marinovum algicola TaxID=42444 RepID=A0A975W950_9RHOB|nr:hypothetical protein SAMN04487940_104212 [Marinovum algicola]SLN47307.1 hypothetical protein MAA5396_02345 [Marinovum algicola]
MPFIVKGLSQPMQPSPDRDTRPAPPPTPPSQARPGTSWPATDARPRIRSGARGDISTSLSHPMQLPPDRDARPVPPPTPPSRARPGTSWPATDARPRIRSGARGDISTSLGYPMQPPPDHVARPVPPPTPPSRARPGTSWPATDARPRITSGAQGGIPSRQSRQTGRGLVAPASHRPPRSRRPLPGPAPGPLGSPLARGPGSRPGREVAS